MNLLSLFHFRQRAALNQVRQEIGRNRLKILVIAFATIGLWFSLYRLFKGGFVFLHSFPDLRDWVVVYVFAIFFFSLQIMLVISNAIISYSSFYHSAETRMLITIPLHPGEIFLYKLTESLMFSSWAFLFLGTPLLLAYGIDHAAGWAFYFWITILIPVFIILPASIGGLITILLGRFLPRRRKSIIITLLAIAVIIGLVIISNLTALRGTAMPFTALWMQNFMYKLTFAQNPMLPSYWITRSLIDAANGQHASALFFFLMLLSNGLFIGLIAFYLARRCYFKAYSLVQSARRDRKYPVRGWIDVLGMALFWFFGERLRLINIKDLKTFIRDPVQWTQFLVFFGILGVYFLNLRNIPYINLKDPFWQYIVSFLNLTATVLTLATFTTRFIYPQLSLEGQRFWILGMIPLTRSQIFYGKFMFAAIGSLLVAEPLIFISSWMLEVPGHMLFYQLYIVFIICMGLSAISITLGTLYPNFREDNPSKIVSGFGGTFNLVASLIYSLGIIGLAIVPGHLIYTKKLISVAVFQKLLFYDIIIITVIGIAVIALSLNIGVRAIKRLEI